MEQGTKHQFLKAAFAVTVWAMGAGLATSARAQMARVQPDGRPALPVPVGANGSQIAPEGNASGVVYEPKRIKRTVPLDITGGLAGKWDVLTVTGEGATARTTYFDWDETYLYLAVETNAPMREARFDLDLANDGWLKGADNLSIFVTPTAEGADAAPTVIAQRFDLAQNKDTPVWAASPIDVKEMMVKAGKTAFGTYVVLVALPRTETVSAARKPGTSVGVRIDAGNLPPYQNEAALIPVRPLLRLVLADQVDAIDGAVSITVDVNKREIIPNGELKATVEVKNSGTAPVRLSRVFLRGAGGVSGELLDDQKFAGAEVAPGKSVKREWKSNLPPQAPMGTFVLSGGADVDGTGKTLTGLTSFDQVEPYSIFMETDEKPVPQATTKGVPTIREARVFVRSRTTTKTAAKVTFTLPEGWKLENDAPTELTMNVAYIGVGRSPAFRVVVPPDAAPGRYAVSAKVEMNGRKYTAAGLFFIAQ